MIFQNSSTIPCDRYRLVSKMPLTKWTELRADSLERLFESVLHIVSRGQDSLGSGLGCRGSTDVYPAAAHREYTGLGLALIDCVYLLFIIIHINKYTFKSVSLTYW